MKNELISMVDRTTQLDNEHIKSKGSYEFFAFGDFHSLSIQYKNFLNTPLNISMFVPAIKVGDKWEVLEMPKECPDGYDLECENCDGSCWATDYAIQYQTAKDNVIFEGFEYKTTRDEYNFDMVVSDKFNIVWDYNDIIYPSRNIKTIQDLIKYKPTLTKKGLDDSGLNNK